jgi:predicted dehydrogenase
VTLPRLYRAAIIGTGRIASLLERDPLRARPHTHAAWYAAEPRTTLVAGCDVDPERLAAFAEDWHVSSAHLYADYRDMLAHERPDIVSICAYAADRVGMCRAAMQAGARGLWIEKAVACAVDEARALDRELAAAGIAAVVDHPRRLDARYRAVGDWLREETYGRLESVHVLFSGHVIHTGTHAWDLLLAWCGPWVRVDASLDEPCAESDRRRGDGRHDDVPRASARRGDADAEMVDRGGRARVVFANGVEAFVTGGAKHYFVFQCDLVCTRGRIRIGNDVWEVLAPSPSPRYTGFDELTPVDPASLASSADGTAGSLLAALVDAMDTGRTPAQSVAAATDALALGIAVMQSGLTGRTVTPDTLDVTLRIASV